jgi:hypothetical protein
MNWSVERENKFSPPLGYSAQGVAASMHTQTVYRTTYSGWNTQRIETFPETAKNLTDTEKAPLLYSTTSPPTDAGTPLNYSLANLTGT